MQRLLYNVQSMEQIPCLYVHTHQPTSDHYYYGSKVCTHSHRFQERIDHDLPNFEHSRAPEIYSCMCVYLLLWVGTTFSVVLQSSLLVTMVVMDS